MRKNLFGNYQIDENGNLYNKSTEKNLNVVFNKKYKLYKINLYVTELKKKKTFYVHRLLASAFVDGFEAEKCKVRFIDGNSKNCQLNNLSVWKKNDDGQYKMIFPIL